MKPENETSPNVRMRESGFSPSEDRGGARWYSQPVDYQGRRALLAVKDDEGLGMPESLEEPVRVGIHDLQTGEELQSKRYPSLGGYLDAFERDPSQPLP